MTAASVFAGAAALLAGCGGGGGGGVTGSTGTQTDSGANKTYLSVQASDIDGDALQYDWRVTAGTIDNRNSAQTVWTMPDGPGLHFAYVTISDGRGGYVEQQYAVSTDALNTNAAQPAAVTHAAATIPNVAGAQTRLRFVAQGPLLFTPPGGGPGVERLVYLPDIPVQVFSGTTLVFSGTTDLAGDVYLPQLNNLQSYDVKCAATPDSPLTSCLSLVGTTQASLVEVARPVSAARNLRLFGHVALADGAVCGTEEEFFKKQSAATARLLLADGTPVTSSLRINHFGDYAIEAAVPVGAALKLQLRCEGFVGTLDVPAAGSPSGYLSTAATELSFRIPNTRPTVARMVANGPDGNARGRMVIAGVGSGSNTLPGNQQFLTYKGKDTQLSACMYYKSFGAARDCDGQGNMIEPISFLDWKRQHRLSPFTAGNGEVVANYINRMDLNLTRHMVATQSAADDIAFYVCNSPGPDGTSQAEIDHDISSGVAGESLVACVAMEWSRTPGINDNLPFTKFLTFGPDGSLLRSINLDGRGEKYMPGACLACHGGTRYNGRFPEQGTPSPAQGSNFLAFDTGNYLFSSGSGLSETAQGESFYALNQLVAATESLNSYSATKTLIGNWYANGHVLDKSFVPAAWRARDATDKPGAARFYHEVVGMSCRTCHASLGSFRYDWDSNPNVLLVANSIGHQHVCGGTADLALNASMPNALVSSDRVLANVGADPTLASLMTSFLGCSSPVADPAYPKR